MKTNVILAAALALISAPAFAQTAPTTNEAEAVGTMATVQGTVVEIADKSEFLMKDAIGLIKVDMGDSAVTFKVGDAVTVDGLVEKDYDRRDMEAHTVTGPDGAVITVTSTDQNDN